MDGALVTGDAGLLVTGIKDGNGDGGVLVTGIKDGDGGVLVTSDDGVDIGVKDGDGGTVVGAMGATVDAGGMLLVTVVSELMILGATVGAKDPNF